MGNLPFGVSNIKTKPSALFKEIFLSSLVEIAVLVDDPVIEPAIGKPAEFCCGRACG
jgi:hypothetical protein